MSSHPVTKVGQPKTGLGPSVMLFQETSGVDPVPPSQSQGLHPHPSCVCLGPQHRHAAPPPRGPTRSSAPDSRDLTLHLYLHLTCRAARQANPRFPTLAASLGGTLCFF